jgi:hypothetical protein
LCRFLTVVSDDDRLHEHIELQAGQSIASVLPNVADGGIQPVGFPAHFVVLPVLKRPTQHGEPDDVGMTSRMGEGLFAVDTYKYGQVTLT